MHISVDPKHVGQAFDALAPLTDPTVHWKVTNMEHPSLKAGTDNRAVSNTQFPLYIKPDNVDGTCNPECLRRVKDLINTVEDRLSTSQIK
ncbi:hypothetical protein ED28_05010 [[Pantoea] beijingensis]|uniref:Uncharacterized protein n=1 Tax=[Pantoea] beijingensis TaxID=1324864 RepID=A0A443IFQ3_9GAMM|nr:hypothetical protein [[Pantoea] beijingensis]RWR02905.1 hypothetical protein ED28_05010 [[Pantoea] beijingensis]